MSRCLLIDGDIIAYQAAASIERPINWGAGEAGEDLWTLHAFEDEGKEKVESMLATIKEACEGDRLVICLSDTANFRKTLYPNYKSNRAGTRKPMCLGPLKQYLIDQYETFIRPELEADDVLGILMTNTKVIPGEKVIVSIDKDLQTIPGLHYRTNEPERGVFEVTEALANWKHLMQALTGDTSDGYPGCPGIGPKKAEEALADFLTEDSFDTKAAWERIVAMYHKAKLGPEVALVQAQIARICRAADYDFKNKKVIPWMP